MLIRLPALKSSIRIGLALALSSLFTACSSDGSTASVQPNPPAPRPQKLLNWRTMQEHLAQRGITSAVHIILGGNSTLSIVFEQGIVAALEARDDCPVRSRLGGFVGSGVDRSRMKTKVAGTIALLAGVFLLGLTAFISYFLYQAIHGIGGHSWHGSPQMTRLTIRLMALLFIFSLNSMAAGAFQLRSGRPNRVLAGITLLLAAALGFTAYHVSAHP